MNPDIPEDIRRLMEELDQTLPPGSSDVFAANGDPMLAAAQRLAKGPDITLSDSALDRIEARLRARTVEVQTVTSKRPSVSPRPRPIRASRIWRYALVASLALVLIITSVTRASAQSLPGDYLYPIKRAVENGRLALVTSSGEPKLRINLAERRTGEFESLLDRNQIHPRSLEEANEQISRALDLLAKGYGDWSALQPRIIELIHEQDNLLMRALPVAADKTQARLQIVAKQNRLIEDRASQPTAIPSVPLPTVTATTSGIEATSPPTDMSPADTTPTHSHVPPTEPAPSPTNTLLPTPTIEPTPISSQTPVPAPLPTQSHSKPDGLPTRTPPGHGDDPGLGDNPPGQGGDHPGQGNNGQPPGQSGDKPGQGNNGQPPGQSGDKPGQGNNDQPPGQSGDKPGQGNNGQPPGQEKPKKEK